VCVQDRTDNGNYIGQMSSSSSMEELRHGSGIVSVVYGGVALLHALLPANKTTGYVCDWQGKPLKYRLNGLLVLGVTVGVWALFGRFGIVPLEFVAEHNWGTVLASCLLGLLGSTYFYLRGESEPERKEMYMRCSTRDRPEKPTATKEDLAITEARGTLKNFFFGFEFNPRFGEFDVKMYLYLIGAVMLALNIYSAAALQKKQDGVLSRAMATYASMFSWFICEYLFFEEIHLYTYDLFAEKIGFKLFWGCMCFYANFYAVGVWNIVAHQPGRDISRFESGAIIALFYAGWIFTRGANMQKFYFKREPTSKTFLWGLIEQKTIPGTRILYSGFWGLSRHINYLGEIAQSLALGLPGYLVSGSLIPFLYPLYYVVLFVPRQIDDDALCAAKYGSAWDEYVQKVPYRIIPFVY